LQSTISAIENLPGNRLMSAEDSSLAAPFIDGALHRQRTNLSNTSVSYYSKGEVIGFVLDLLIRGRTGGEKSLDDILRQTYEEFYVKSPNANYYLKGRGYTGLDFAQTVSKVAGTDMSGFFLRHVSGVDPLPYDEALAYVGLRLVRSPAPRTAGIVIDPSDFGSLRLGALRSDSDAERAGLQQGDVLLSIAGRPVTGGNWRVTLNGFQEGDRVPVSVRRSGRIVERSIVLGPPDTFDYVIEEMPGASPAARALRAAWLGN
jgi:predicted metalloprotease with PDZ domain